MSADSSSNVNRTQAKLAIEKILKQYKVSVEHPEACLAEAASREANPGLDDASLAQWQDQPFVTIDNPDSRDLDQALLIERKGDSDFRVRYALADAAYYVPPGSALFTEALQRGVTYYTPLLAAPMLPPSLSEGLVSLNPHKKRRALVFDMTLKHDGTCLNTTVTRALICSQAKLSYASVQQYYDALQSEQSHEYHNTSWSASLRLLRQLGEVLIQRARDRDVIPFNRSEAEITLNDKGLTIRQRARVRTEKYNEQISLLCNMQGAQMLKALSQDNDALQAIFRAHDAPLQGRLNTLRKILDDFANKAQLSEQWRWKQEQSLADYVASLSNEAQHRGKLLAVERQILVSNQASEYRSEPGRHHALAASSYARFSSPMREIVGIFTHKELLEALGQQPSAYTVDNAQAIDDDQLRDHIISVANQSRQTQKQINKRIEFIALQSVLDQDLAASHDVRRKGIVMGFRKDRIYVNCESIATDLKVTTSDLQVQYKTEYQLDDVSAWPLDQQAPSWLLGDEVEISVVAFDAGEKRFQLALHKT